MKILLKNIKENLMQYTGEVECKNILNNGDDIKFEDNIKFEGNLRKGEDFVEIKGKVNVKFITNCHACGDEARGKVEFEIFEVYRRMPSDDEYELIGDEVDFDDMILENIRLNLPIKILCRKECKGICPTCKKNLNDGECNCKLETKKSSPFDILTEMMDK